MWYGRVAKAGGFLSEQVPPRSDTTENITFLQTIYAGGNNSSTGIVMKC